MLDKTTLKDKLLALEEQQLAATRRSYASHLHDSAVDPTEPRDDDEMSRAEASAEMAQAFEGPANAYDEAIRTIRAIDFGRKSEVEPGAALRLAGRWYVVAVPTQAFDCDGQTVMGISTSAPIFKAAEGKRAGETFEINGQTWRIEAVA